MWEQNWEGIDTRSVSVDDNLHSYVVRTEVYPWESTIFYFYFFLIDWKKHILIH